MWAQAGAFIFGALAVGLIALARELVVDRARWRREQVANDRVTRTARRLVADELDSVRNHLALMLRKGMWPVPEYVERAGFLPNDEWTQHKGRLAEALDDENTWTVIVTFEYSLGQLRARALTAQPGVRLTAQERERLQAMHDQAHVLYAVLATGTPLPDDWETQLEMVREAGALPTIEEEGGETRPLDV